MAEETPSKPTRDETSANILRLGHLLHQYDHPMGPLGFSRPIEPDERERLRVEITALEKRIEQAVCDSRQWLLRGGVFGLRGREVVDPLAVRIVAYVAWGSLGSERPDASVARVANAAAMGDWATHLEARRLIRQLVARGTAIGMRDSEYNGDILHPNAHLVRFLSGDGNLPVLFSGKSIQEEREEWEKRRQADVLRKVRTPRQARTEPPPEASTTGSSPPILQTPRGIFEALRKTVIGIDPVVRKFAVQMAIHMKRVAIADKGGVPSTPPVCVLCCGPSGSGKSFLVSEFGRLSGLPFAIGDMSQVTASAYVGTSVDELFYGFAKNGAKLADAQRGVLFLDEIDKKRTNNRGGDFDATGAGVQYELLRMLEGTRIQVGGKRGNDSVPKFFVHTGSMAFVMGGAFSSVVDLLATKTRCPIGFSGGNADAEMAPDVRELLLEYFIPELVNRIGSVIVIPPPSQGQLIQIATAPEGIIGRLNQFLGCSFGLQVVPSPEAI